MRKLKPLRCRTPALYLSTLHDIHSDDELEDKEIPYVRKTITVSPLINKWIQEFRADSMKDDLEQELDYTYVADFLMAYGIIFIEQYEKDKDDDKRAEDLVGDRIKLTELSLRDRYDSLFDAREPVDEDDSNSVKGKKKDDVPEAK